MIATLEGYVPLRLLFYLLIGVVTYYGSSLVQTLFHRIFGHARRIAKLHDVHVSGHHAQYAQQLLSDRWIPTEQHITWYYARGVKKLEPLNPQGFMEVDEGLMKDLCRAPLWPDELETNARVCHRFG